MVKEMLRKFDAIGVKMSVKLHYLHCHFDKFHKDLKNVSDQHGERFHQTIATFESRFAACHNHENMLADFLWLSCRN